METGLTIAIKVAKRTKELRNNESLELVKGGRGKTVTGETLEVTVTSIGSGTESMMSYRGARLHSLKLMRSSVGRSEEKKNEESILSRGDLYVIAMRKLLFSVLTRIQAPTMPKLLPCDPRQYFCM